jgi:hypothetical protein
MILRFGLRHLFRKSIGNCIARTGKFVFATGFVHPFE